MGKTIDARIQLASLNRTTGDVLTTFVLTYPRIILPEVLTHRVFSRSTASSRATPAKRIRKQVLDDPFVPTYIDKNKAGMQGGEPFSGEELKRARTLYKLARLPACGAHWLMEKFGVHKQITNRLLEPWVWVEQVVSTTDLQNFFKLRTHWMAEPHFQELAKKMLDLQCKAEMGLFKLNSENLDATKSSRNFELREEGIENLAVLYEGAWHLPFAEEYMGDEDGARKVGKIVSSARCARVSYYLRDGVKSDIASDIELYNKLCGSDPKHLSPLEHPAECMPAGRYANFSGFRQHRFEAE